MHRQVSATYERHRITYIAYGWTPLDRQTWQSWHDLDIANGHAVVGCDCHKGNDTSMKNQEDFDKVVRHLFTQKEKAFRRHVNHDPQCAYRGDNGLKCAIGALISDEEYDPKMEGLGVKYLKDKFPNVLVGSDFDFLDTLQNVHDCFPIEGWEEKLRGIAALYNLTFPEDAIQKEG